MQGACQLKKVLTFQWHGFTVGGIRQQAAPLVGEKSQLPWR
jgi:hypothetical protein